MSGEGHGRRRVVPEGWPSAAFLFQEAVEQDTLRRDHVLRPQPLGKMGHRDLDSPRPGRDVQYWLGARSELWLFENHHPIASGRPAQEMLRPLPDEIPAQMRETDEQASMGGRELRRPFWSRAVGALQFRVPYRRDHEFERVGSTRPAALPFRLDFQVQAPFGPVRMTGPQRYYPIEVHTIQAALNYPMLIQVFLRIRHMALN